MGVQWERQKAIGLGPLHKYSNIFEKWDFFNVAYSNRFSPSTPKPEKDAKYDNIPYGACVKLEVYDVWHHRIRKLPFPSVNEKPAFIKITAVESVFEKLRFRLPKCGR